MAATRLGQPGRADAAGGAPKSGLPGLGRPSQPVARPLVVAPSTSNLAPATPAHLYELGLTRAAMGFHAAAIEILRDCTAREPGHAGAWRELARLLRLADRDEEASAAEAVAGAAPGSAAAGRSPGPSDKAERKLRDSLRGKTGEPAMAVLRTRLAADPRDVAAMRLLAELELRAGDTMTAWDLLERALRLCPGYVGAREDYAESLLERRARVAVAAAQTTRLLDHAPRNARYRGMHAYALMFTGRHAEAADLLAGLLRERPREAGDWRLYAQALHALGRRDESERAFRKCLDLRPDMGEAYWGLADLKGRFVKEADISAIRDHLAADTLRPGSRMHMLYAMAHTLEQAGDFAASFAAYEEGARLSREITEKSLGGYRPNQTLNCIRRQKAVFTRENLDGRLMRAPTPASGPTPIFIVGMPRAGSTLLEQILASHSLVEASGELPVIDDLTYELAHSRMLATPDAYPDCLLGLAPDQLAALGALVIERAGAFRHGDRPFFVDKRPWNWLEAGLIHVILPHAKIIDIRREPMAACFAMFKQMLPVEAGFTNDLGDLGRYYTNYSSLMAHWRDVLPGAIHFLRYESLVEDTEAEIRRLLDYCGLPFEEGCLRFWETDRAIATPSSEQVRRPIFRGALEQWRNFEPWLGPLREALDQPPQV